MRVLIVSQKNFSFFLSLPLSDVLISFLHRLITMHASEWKKPNAFDFCLSYGKLNLYNTIPIWHSWDDIEMTFEFWYHKRKQVEMTVLVWKDF